MNVKAGLTKANDKNGDNNKTEDDWQGDFADLELPFMLADIIINFEISETKNCENDGELRYANAGAGEIVKDEPGM